MKKKQNLWGGPAAPWQGPLIKNLKSKTKDCKTRSHTQNSAFLNAR